jgi:hypothetical protein
MWKKDGERIIIIKEGGYYDDERVNMISDDDEIDKGKN